MWSVEVNSNLTSGKQVLLEYGLVLRTTRSKNFKKKKKRKKKFQLINSIRIDLTNPHKTSYPIHSWTIIYNE